jgi:hypothetical protein
MLRAVFALRVVLIVIDLTSRSGLWQIFMVW